MSSPLQLDFGILLRPSRNCFSLVWAWFASVAPDGKVSLQWHSQRSHSWDNLIAWHMLLLCGLDRNLQTLYTISWKQAWHNHWLSFCYWLCCTKGAARMTSTAAGIHSWMILNVGDIHWFSLPFRGVRFCWFHITVHTSLWCSVPECLVSFDVVCTAIAVQSNKHYFVWTDVQIPSFVATFTKVGGFWDVGSPMMQLTWVR